MPESQDIKNEVLSSLRASLPEKEYNKIPSDVLETLVNYYVEKNNITANQHNILDEQNSTYNFLNELQEVVQKKSPNPYWKNIFNKLDSHFLAPLSEVCKQINGMYCQASAPFLSYAVSTVDIVGTFIPIHKSLKTEAEKKIGKENFFDKSFYIITAALLLVAPHISLLLYAGKILSDPILGKWFSNREKISPSDRDVVVKQSQEFKEKIGSCPELNTSLQKATSIKKLADLVKLSAKDIMLYNPSIELLDDLRKNISDNRDLENLIKNIAAFSNGFIDLHSKNGVEAKHLLDDIGSKMKEANFSAKEIEQVQKIVMANNEKIMEKSIQLVNTEQNREVGPQIIRSVEATKKYVTAVTSECEALFQGSFAKTKLIQQVLQKTLVIKEKKFINILKNIDKFTTDSQSQSKIKGKLGFTNGLNFVRNNRMKESKNIGQGMAR